ncbi:MAG TPA: DUF5666 domain-containing protein [Candidatus Paceibacterota bacterium]
MKNKFAIFLALILTLPLSVQAFSGSEVHITKDGKASFTEVKIMQIAGGTFYARLYWGNAYVRITVKTNSKTKFYRGTGEVTTISEISEGNIVDVSGELESGSDTLTLITSSIKNSSVQKAQYIFSGTVTEVRSGSGSFVLETKTHGSVTVETSATTRFIKGNRTLDLAHVKVGDIVLKTSGDYDLSTKVLIAQSVTTYINPTTYTAKNFEGVLQEITSSISPASIKLKVGNIVYVVNISPTALIMNKNRGSVLLSRFIVGDTVRVYGAVREVDDPIIDATLVRNTSL